jgi:hypothetical protein
VQLISLSVYQPGLKQIDFAAALNLPSDEFEAGELDNERRLGFHLDQHSPRAPMTGHR